MVSTKTGMKITAFWVIAQYSLVALMMEAARTSQTSVYFNETARRYIPEGYRLQTRRRENLKSHAKRHD
jgi:hypothetical protein